ncbi:UNVERIFIED_CONTAM: APO protein 3, mitochondrial [Sesamum angustifolium]|uniref:APO protein 3, mitochondrial n=1 Tax=Sesamum angustifolium TaxID=2727405 RepID=A0AAW2QUD2_9LAMI
MFCRRSRTALSLHQIFTRRIYEENLAAAAEVKIYDRASYSTGSGFRELSRKLKRSERKPWVTDINELKRKSRLEKQERRVVRETTLKPPENGLLVKELIPVAHEVLAARTQLLTCVSRVAESIPIFVCSVCGDVHVGDPPHKIRTCNVSGSQKNKEHTWERGGVDHVFPVVESFHLYDRLGRAVSHNERLQVDRIPAVVELCIQAGVEIPEYPTRRFDFPVYRVAGRLIDFEKRFPKYDLSGRDIKPFGFWEMAKRSKGDQKPLTLPYNDLKGFGAQGMEAFEKMCYGIIRLMQKYAVQTCGYCPEVQVGPKGHRVRQCQAFKHQMRDGQHAWQEATVDDLVPPVYVWHIQDPHNPLLIDALKRYYGKLPALVELFGQAGAEVGQNYWAMMREDVVVPGLDEEKLVV